MASSDEDEYSMLQRRTRIRTHSHGSMTTSCDENDAADPSEQRVEDVTVKLFYKPRTLITLAACILSMTYFSFVRDADANQHDNFWHGCLGALALFLVICQLICPNGPFIRPNPALWRLVFGLSVIYTLCLAFLLFQSYKDIIIILRYFDPELKGAEPDTEVYAEDCSINVFWSRLDIFCIAHFLGYAVKSLMLRNASMLWLLSITWEFTEIAFSHLLENFKECWWDSLFLDIILCNGLGIHFGLYICKVLEMKTYYWESVKDIQGASKKFRRVVMQFTPVSWTEVRWFDPNCVRMRYVSLCVLCVLWQISELNTFFLKHIFVIPTGHWLNVARIVLISIIVMPTIRQYYLYSTDTRCKKLGTQAWMFVCITCLEALLCVRHAKELFSQTQYTHVFIWVLFQLFCCLVLLYVLFIWRGKRKYKNELSRSSIHAKSSIYPESTKTIGSVYSTVTKVSTSPQNLRFQEENYEGGSDSDEPDALNRQCLRRSRRKKQT